MAGMIVTVLEFFLRYVLLIESDIQLTLNFSAGSLCIPKEAEEFSVHFRIKPFCNVMH